MILLVLVIVFVMYVFFLKKEFCCWFVLDWIMEEIIKNLDKFVWDMLYWEGQFYCDKIVYNVENGMIFDGWYIDFVMGEFIIEKLFSVLSKEVSWSLLQKCLLLLKYLYECSIVVLNYVLYAGYCGKF